MNGQPAYLRERLGTSIWLIPLLVCAASLVLGIAMLWADRVAAQALAQWHLVTLTVSAARQLLGVIAGSVISVGGVAFSVTMVALTLTSGQYGPRILRHFLEDTASKLSLGLFLGTFVYCLVVLAGYGEADRPQLTVVVAVVLALMALVSFIRFIHGTATDLQADQIVERIGGQLCAVLGRLSDENAAARRSDDTLAWRRGARGARALDVATRKSGYVQSIDYDALAEWCRASECRLLVRTRAGKFLVPGQSVFRLFVENPEAIAGVAEELDWHMLAGPIRTAVQDPEYPITQLNQLAARALSPGINDPGTAITCIDGFSRALAQIVDRDLPGCVVDDAEGSSRVLASNFDFAGILKAVYSPLRQFARADVAVSVRLMESLIALAELTRRVDRLELLGSQANMIWQGFEREEIHDSDLSDLGRRYRRMQALVARCGPDSR